MIATGGVLAVVNVDLAVVPCESGGTATGVLTNTLLKTLSSMLARVGVALIHLLITCRPCVTLWTVADVSGDIVLTDTSCTGVVPALVHVSLTSLAIPAGLATAVIVVNLVSAPAIVEARVARALVNIFFAESSSVARLTLASVLVDLVDTVTTIETGIGRALIDIDFTVVAICTRLAVALVSIAIPRLLTNPVMLARVDFANLDPPVAETSSIAWIAAAGEPVDAINTAASLANIVRAIVPINFTAGARETFRTFAGIGVNGVMADTVVVAWVRGAVVDVELAVDAAVPIDAGALVLVHPIGADAVVLARIA